MSTVIEGVFKQAGQADTVLPVLVDNTGKLLVTSEGAGGGATEATLSAINTKIPAQAITGLLPVDTLGTPGTPRIQATGAAAVSIVLTTTCRRVSMYATTGTWYSISGTATATSHYIGPGERLDFDVPTNTTISVLQETSAGSVRITELV